MNTIRWYFIMPWLYAVRFVHGWGYKAALLQTHSAEKRIEAALAERDQARLNHSAKLADEKAALAKYEIAQTRIIRAGIHRKWELR